MATTTNRQQLLNSLFTQLKKKYGEPPAGEDLPVLEHLLYAACREGAGRAEADKAFRNLKERFFDWNEVRVSAPEEVEEALAGLPDRAAKAKRIIGVLQEIFEMTFSFDLQGLAKKGLKDAARQLARYQDVNDYLVAWVTQRALGGHAVPLDAPTLRATRRLGLVDEGQDDPEAVRASLEHLVPKAKGPLFNELVSALAKDVCVEGAPNCPACALKHECPTGQAMLAAAAAEAATTRTGRLKSR
jgi:endonuclease-3